MICGTFQETVERFLIEDPRYPLEAYFFVRDGFEYTANRSGEGAMPHGKTDIGARELCFGFKEFALDEFGPMAAYTLGKWNLFSTSDFGEIVCNLVKMRIFSKTEKDRREDFDNVFDLQAELRRPYGE